ncbi:hypothetical protein LLG95_14490 [bacterium]|nr:hypothetical protein [bacterium]
MALTVDDVEHLHESIKKLLEAWMRIKLIFQKAFGEGPITPEHENAYLQLKSEVSRLYRMVSDRLPRGLAFEGDKMMEMLKNAMTMEHLSNQGAAERQNYYAGWHRIYLKITRALGALEVMKSGYYPHMHRDRLRSKEPVKKK